MSCLSLVAGDASHLYFAAVERHVKERLVGAAVLIAAAIILIPEMLSGPKRDARNEPTAANDETPLKTYTIDLTKSPATQAAQSAIDNRASPPEASPETQPETSAAAAEPAPNAQTNPESTPAAVEPAVADGAAGAGRPAAASPPTDAPVQPSRQPSAQAAAAPRTPVPAPAATKQSSAAPAAAGTATEGWAVQLGSFASRVTADRMVKTLRADGYAAFVMPVKSGQATLYRVRIGPMQDRESAAQTLRKVKATAPGAAVVVHP